MDRKPPSQVRRALRKEVGYGCPIKGCRSPFLQWHHFDPPWREKQHHDESGMIALCGEHHDAADANAYSKERLHELKKGPYSSDDVKAHFPWSQKTDLIVRLGGNYSGGNQIALMGNNQPIISLSRDEEGLVVLSLTFKSPNGLELLSIDENYLSVEPSAIHDLECKANQQSIKVWFGVRNIGLELQFMRLTEPEFDAQLNADYEASEKIKPSSFSEFFPLPNWPSTDILGKRIKEWADKRCRDSDGLYPMINVLNMTVYQNGRKVVIRNGIGENKPAIIYSAAFDNGRAGFNIL